MTLRKPPFPPPKHMRGVERIRAKAPTVLIRAEARCSECSVVLRVPVKLVSEANRRGAWYVHDGRRKAQRKAVAAVALLVHPTHTPPPHRAYVVTITRIAPRALDTDNLASSAKAIRDQIAMWLGIDDSPRGPATWIVSQRVEGKSYGAEATIAW